MAKRADSLRRDRRDVPDRQESTPQTTALARLLDAPHLAHVVARLTPDVLHHLIRHHGLEACSALVAVATPQQIASILDLDLWQPAAPGVPGSAGINDQFDAQRFGMWLEALMEEGDATAAGVVAKMDEPLAIAGLSRYVRVFDPGVFEPTNASDLDWHENVGRDFSPGSWRRNDDALESEVGGYVIRARTTRAWDAIVGLLITLADEHPACFHALMQGCRRLSNSTPEDDELDELLLEPEQLLHDVSIGREQRRTEQGYLTPGDARAFLEMAKRPRATPGGASREATDPIAAAYFRSLEEAAGPPATASVEASPGVDVGASSDAIAESMEAVAELLAEAGVAPAQPRALLGPAGADAPIVEPLQPLMARLHDANVAAYLKRNQELTFLANALLAGCSVYDRPFTIKEAWDAAVGVCNIGLQVRGGGDDGAALPETFLADHDLVAVFQDGWQVLHEEISVHVCDRVIATLAEVRHLDSEVARDLDRMRRTLQRRRAAGEPLRAQETLEPIAILDTPAWAGLCGLLSECPVLPDVLPAMLAGRASAVSATAFVSFSTRAQIRLAHQFTDRLRDLLMG
jgi:hypothetical protein